MKTVDNIIRPRSDEDFVHSAWKMEELGSFASRIARAYYVADDNNKIRLRAAFPDLFTQGYHAWVREQVELKV